jgi:hypothetical protein
MMCTLCAFIITKSSDLLLYRFPYIYICVVINNLAKNGSQEAFGCCEGFDSGHVLGFGSLMA